MESIDSEALAVRAIQQARLLVHRAELESKVAIQQAVALLLDRGMSQREVAKLTGLSKSDVARQSLTRPPRGVAQMKGSNDRVYTFAAEWIWGSTEKASYVVDQLLQHGEDEADQTPQGSSPVAPTRRRIMDQGYSGSLPTNFGGLNGPAPAAASEPDLGERDQ